MRSPNRWLPVILVLSTTSCAPPLPEAAEPDSVHIVGDRWHVDMANVRFDDCVDGGQIWACTAHTTAADTSIAFRFRRPPSAGVMSTPEDFDVVEVDTGPVSPTNNTGVFRTSFDGTVRLYVTPQSDGNLGARIDARLVSGGDASPITIAISAAIGLPPSN